MVFNGLTWGFIDLYTNILAVSVNWVFSPFMAYLYCENDDKNQWMVPWVPLFWRTNPLEKFHPQIIINTNKYPKFVGTFNILQGRDPCINNWIVDNLISWGSAVFFAHHFLLDLRCFCFGRGWVVKQPCFWGIHLPQPQVAETQSRHCFQIAGFGCFPQGAASTRASDWLWGNQPIYPWWTPFHSW